MRKKLMLLVTAALMSLSSCTDVFEPQVDYGPTTIVNNYSELVKAVNDLTKTLGDRFDALNALLKENAASMRIAIDENTGAIKVLDQKMESGLSAINTTLFNGFKALGTSIDENGNRTIVAMNDNGNLLRLQLDKVGQLISATMKETVADLIKTINSFSASVAAKMDALTTIAQAGLADVSVKIDDQTKQIKVSVESLNAELATMNTTMFDGFKAVKEQMAANGTQTVSAINANGEILRLQIDTTGKLISAQIETSAAKLAETLNSFSATLAEKLEALTKVAEAGLADISLKIDTQTTLLVASIQNVDKTLGYINTTMFDGFKATGEVLTTEGDKIVTAINDKGEAIQVQIDKSGKLVSAQIESTGNDLAKAINDASKSLDERFKALTSAIQQGLADIKLEINTQTKEIRLQCGYISEKLGNIDASITNGFYVLSQVTFNTGVETINAINNAGLVLSAQVDKSGKVISAQIETSTDAIKSAINGQTSTLAEKMDAINKTAELGLANIKVSVDASTAAIKLGFSQVNGQLGLLNVNVFDGFNAVSQKIDENGNKVVTAMDNLGQTITLTVDNNGKLIAGQIETSANALGEILNSKLTSVADKIEALNQAIAAKLAEVKISIDKNTSEISARLLSLDSSIQSVGILTYMIAEKAGTIIKEGMNNIVFAINEQGQALKFVIDDKGNLVSASILDSTKKICDAINSSNTSMVEKMAAMTSAIEQGFIKVSVGIDKQTDALNLQIQNIDASMQTINQSVVDGFTLVHESVDAAGNKIETAINDKGDILVATIDAQGNAIKLAIEDAAKLIKQVINDSNATIAEKIGAVNATIKEGLATVTASIDKNTGEVTVGFKNLNKKLDDMVTTAFSAALLTKKVLDGYVNKIVLALKDNSQVISLAIGQNGEVTKAGFADLKAAAEGNTEAVKNLTTAVSEFANANKSNLEAIDETLGELNKKLASLGVVLKPALDNLGRMTVALEQIPAKLDAINVNLTDGKTQLIAKQEDIAKAIRETKDELSKKGDEISKAILALLSGMQNSSNGGIFKIGDNVYMTQTAKAAVDALDKNSDLYRGLATYVNDTYPLTAPDIYLNGLWQGGYNSTHKAYEVSMNMAYGHRHDYSDRVVEVTGKKDPVMEADGDVQIVTDGDKVYAGYKMKCTTNTYLCTATMPRYFTCNGAAQVHGTHPVGSTKDFDLKQFNINAVDVTDAKGNRRTVYGVRIDGYGSNAQAIYQTALGKVVEFEFVAHSGTKTVNTVTAEVQAYRWVSSYEDKQLIAIPEYTGTK